MHNSYSTFRSSGWHGLPLAGRGRGRNKKRNRTARQTQEACDQGEGAETGPVRDVHLRSKVMDRTAEDSNVRTQAKRQEELEEARSGSAGCFRNTHNFPFAGGGSQDARRHSRLSMYAVHCPMSVIERRLWRCRGVEWTRATTEERFPDNTNGSERCSPTLIIHQHLASALAPHAPQAWQPEPAVRRVRSYLPLRMYDGPEGRIVYDNPLVVGPPTRAERHDW